jgi:hypothetical protein
LFIFVRKNTLTTLGGGPSRKQILGSLAAAAGFIACVAVARVSNNNSAEDASDEGTLVSSVTFEQARFRRAEQGG